MKHRMRLSESAFEKIKTGKKQMEIRCNDEKRQLLKVGDVICFYKLPEEKEELKLN